MGMKVEIIESGTQGKELPPKSDSEVGTWGEFCPMIWEIEFSPNQKFIMRQSSFTPYKPGTIREAQLLENGKIRITS